MMLQLKSTKPISFLGEYVFGHGCVKTGQTPAIFPTTKEPKRESIQMTCEQ